MIHGPCGPLNPRFQCMEKGRCSRQYPKPFRTETLDNKDGYPEYRRRDTGRSYDVGNGIMVNSRWVVPYKQ